MATHIWHKPDARSRTPYEHIIVWSKTYQRLQQKVWTIPILDLRSLKDFKAHPTQKPLRLTRNLVELYTKEGQTILDPFAGTGTTGVAAQQLKRHYILIEHNTEYAGFAQQRLRPAPSETTEEREPQEPTPINTSPNKGKTKR